MMQPHMIQDAAHPSLFAFFEKLGRFKIPKGFVFYLFFIYLILLFIISPLLFTFMISLLIIFKKSIFYPTSKISKFLIPMDEQHSFDKLCELTMQDPNII